MICWFISCYVILLFIVHVHPGYRALIRVGFYGDVAVSQWALRGCVRQNSGFHVEFYYLMVSLFIHVYLYHYYSILFFKGIFFLVIIIDLT